MLSSFITPPVSYIQRKAKKMRFVEKLPVERLCAFLKALLVKRSFAKGKLLAAFTRFLVFHRVPLVAGPQKFRPK
jgi:hypothetical protein